MLALIISYSERVYALGVGISLISPTGISFKSSKNGSTAVTGAMSWNFNKFSSLVVGQLHYLVHEDPFFYYGIGVRYKRYDHEKYDPNDPTINVKDYHKHGEYFDLGHSDEDQGELNILTARVPLGVRSKIDSEKLSRLEAYAELGLLMNLAPSTFFGADVAVGIRFFLDD